jgi:hypothetical protein
MSINTVIEIQCGHCSTVDHIQVAYEDICGKLIQVISEYRADGWLIGSRGFPAGIPAICSDCRETQEPFDRADARHPERM